MAEHLRVMISSTARDLPDHRKEVMEACTRMEMFYADMMEHLTATDGNALEVSLRMADKAELYIGVFAYRYGYVPEGKSISVTEAEYNCSVERGIPRLIFLMSDEHPVKPSDVETGPGAEKLTELRKRIEKENVVAYFDSPADLRGKVIQALVPFRKPGSNKSYDISDIPKPPGIYVAHPYTLLQTHGLIGRQNELSMLTDWVAKPDSDIYRARILNIVAIGGMGKSALTWKWFDEIAPEEMKDLAGRMWWSFYESDGSFENFISRALAYVSQKSLDEVQKISPPDRETQLLALLDQKPFLIVLDGLERILIAYARMDAAHLSDDDFDQLTANIVTDAYGLPESAAQSFVGEHRLRKTADPRVGAFLKKLSKVRAARILVSTRLYPADLQIGTGLPFPGCYALFLPGLSDNDALDLWRAVGVTGSREALLPLFHRIGNYPLLIQALAGEIARYRRDPGNFDSWKEDNPDFDPFSLPLKQVKSHVLAFALQGLDSKAHHVLKSIAAFRNPEQYDTLNALLVGDEKPCANAHELDEVLTELEDRGLVGWDKRANRYDLHPIVRGVVWSGLEEEARQGIYTNLQAHFESVPMIENYLEVESLDDLAPAIELYYTLVGLGRFDDAYRVFYDRLSKATLYRLSASRQRVELLEMLFPDETDNPPRLSSQGTQSFTLNALAQGHQFSGQPGRAVPLFRRSNDIDRQMRNDGNFGVGLRNLSMVLRLSGGLRESEGAARKALEIAHRMEDRFREAASLYLLGLTLAARGDTDESRKALYRALRIDVDRNDLQGICVDNAYLAQRAVWLGEHNEAAKLADRAWELAHINRLERDFIRAARIQGKVALELNDMERAEERLHIALTRARAVDLVEEELSALIALAELKRRQGDEKAAREFLDDVWEYAERGPYPMFHADALNVLAQIELDAGNIEAAKKAATEAYKKAWCDGPPYAYHWGLEKAKKHLTELEVAFPEMEPFDESRFEPMPEVEIDPDDEFHVGEEE